MVCAFCYAYIFRSTCVEPWHGRLDDQAKTNPADAQPTWSPAHDRICRHHLETISPYTDRQKQ